MKYIAQNFVINLSHIVVIYHIFKEKSNCVKKIWQKCEKVIKIITKTCGKITIFRNAKFWEIW